jgi:hypothetical protein
MRRNTVGFQACALAAILLFWSAAARAELNWLFEYRDVQANLHFIPTGGGSPTDTNQQSTSAGMFEHWVGSQTNTSGITLNSSATQDSQFTVSGGFNHFLANGTFGSNPRTTVGGTYQPWGESMALLKFVIDTPTAYTFSDSTVLHNGSGTLSSPGNGSISLTSLPSSGTLQPGTWTFSYGVSTPLGDTLGASKAFNIDFAVAPEPAGAGLLAAGLLILRRRRR